MQQKESIGEQFDNRLLSYLNSDDIALLSPSFRMVVLERNALLYDPGQTVETVYFPCGQTMVSFVVDTEEGRPIEIMLVGREGAVGGIVSHGRLPAFSRIKVQSGGNFIAIPISVLEVAKQKSRSLDSLFSRYADCMLAQIFQTTACNAAHTIEQRTCKWLVEACERTQTLEVLLTQDQLSGMLGVGRSYISRVIKKLKQANILGVRRGIVAVHDLTKLQANSCRCNESVKEHFDLVLRGVYPPGMQTLK